MGKDSGGARLPFAWFESSNRIGGRGEASSALLGATRGPRRREQRDAHARRVSTKCQRNSRMTPKQCCLDESKLLVCLVLHPHCGCNVRTHNPLVVGSIPT